MDKSEKRTTYTSEPVQEPSFLKQVWELETTDPERRSANLKMLTAVGLFTGGIAFLKFAGDLITPVF